MRIRRFPIVLAVAAVAVTAAVVALNVPSSSVPPATTVQASTAITAPPAVPSVKVVPSSTHFTGTFPADCHADGKRPDPVCTPGSARDTVTQATIATTICVTGWTATVRPPQAESGPEKVRAMKVYGVPLKLRSVTELDHLVPLELGGSNDVSNLWPEPSDIPNAKFRNTKDHVENVLADLVCGRVRGHSVVPLAAAQTAIATDWTTALAKFGAT